MGRKTTIDLMKEAMKFSAGHFTIFSATEREALHGHNFTVGASLVAEIPDDGLLFDYGVYKHRLIEICREYNEIFLLPDRSPYLRIERGETQTLAHFNGVAIPFLNSDVKVLPISNVTVEELAFLLLDSVVEFRKEQGHDAISEIVVKVFSGPGQSASAVWPDA